MSTSIPNTSGTGESTRLTAVLAAAVMIWSMLVFVPVWSAEFVSFDDFGNLLENERFRGLSAEHLKWMFTTTHYGHYQPLSWVSFAINYTFSGLNPAAYLGTNAVLHALNGALVFLVTRRILSVAVRTGSNPGRLVGGWRDVAAFFGAMIFVAHPMRAESVAWATERRDVLSAFFLLAATFAYLGAAQRVPSDANSAANGRLPKRALGLVLLLLILSLLSKAWGMSFFVIMLILDVYPARRLPPNPLRWFGRDQRARVIPVLLEKVPFAALGVITAVVASHAQRSVFAAWSLEEWSVKNRVVQAIYGVFFYLFKTLVPSDLSPLYELPHGMTGTEPRFLAAYGAVAAALVGAFLVLRKFPGLRLPLLAAAGSYVVLISPVLGVFQSGDQFVATRYSYLACISVSMLMGVGAAMWLAKPSAAPVAAGSDGDSRAPAGDGIAAHGPAAAGSQIAAAGWLAVCGVFLGLGIMTYRQAATWRNTETLWRHGVEVTPTPYVISHLALELARLGRDVEAVPYFERALKLNPRDGRSWFSLGSVLDRLGRADDAERAMRRAAETMPQAYMAFVNLGGMLMSRGRVDEAIASFRAAVTDVERGGDRPLSSLPYLALGNALKGAGDLAGAEANFRRALESDETRAAAERELAALGRSDRAAPSGGAGRPSAPARVPPEGKPDRPGPRGG